MFFHLNSRISDAVKIIRSFGSLKSLCDLFLLKNAKTEEVGSDLANFFALPILAIVILLVIMFLKRKQLVG